jgi:tetratricopeptide (TPR) repeat protein
MNRALRRQQKKQGRKVADRRAGNTDKKLARALAALKSSDAADAFRLAFAVYKKSNRDDAAELAVHAALRIKPMDDAVAAFAQLADAAPMNADIQNDFGGLLCQANRFGEAEHAFRRALELDGENGETLFNLGQPLMALERYGDAEAVFRRVVELMPDNPGAYAGLGDALDAQDRALDALEHFRRAHNLEPANKRFRDKLEAALKHCGTGLEAREKMYRADLINNPGDFASAMQLACVLSDTERRAEAREVIEVWLPKEHELATEDRAQLREILSELQFLGGDFKAAMPNYHWRLKRWKRWGGEPVQPEWHGEPLDGKTILVFAEQGVGDQVMFMALLADLRARCAHVILESDPRLVPLFQRSFPGVTCVSVENPPVQATLAADIDYHVAMGSLGCWLWDDFTARAAVPYLRADPEKTKALRDKYKAGEDVRLVGLAWQSPLGRFAGMKSLLLRDLEPVFKLSGTRFVDLQYGETEPERTQLESDLGVAIVHDDDIDQMTDLDAFAAQIAAMDGVLAVSGSAAHMAGALGVPTSVLLSPAPQWKWGGAGDDAVWYSSVQLLRRAYGESKDAQLARAAAFVREL